MKMDVKHKNLISVYETIKKEIRNGRWVGISEDDITHSYDTNTATTNIIVKFADRNNHTHICTFQYNPDFRIEGPIKIEGKKATWKYSIYSCMECSKALKVSMMVLEKY